MYLTKFDNILITESIINMVKIVKLEIAKKDISKLNGKKTKISRIKRNMNRKKRNMIKTTTVCWSH